MTDSVKFPPQRGFSWRGDWQRRLSALLAERGLSSVQEFAVTSPTKSFVDLANELGPGDVAAIQLQWRALDEAKAAGSMERCARDLFVRNLHEELESGWCSPETDRRRLAMAIGAWSSSISSHLPEYKVLVVAMGHALISENPFPIGWLPVDLDDPLLVEFFKRHWREPDIGK